MSSKHTPGPWFWGAEMHDSRVLAQAAPASWGDRTIAEVHHGEDVMGEANGHLIAAAPDLLEACEQALLWLGDGNPASNYPGDVVRGRMRAAIKKARGE